MAPYVSLARQHRCNEPAALELPHVNDDTESPVGHLSIDHRENRSRSVFPHVAIRKIRRLLPPQDRSHELLRGGAWIAAPGLLVALLLARSPAVLRLILRPDREASDALPPIVAGTQFLPSARYGDQQEETK